MRADNNNDANVGIVDSGTDSISIIAGVGIVGSDKKIENLSKAKIIQKLTKSKKSDSAKAKKLNPTNRAFKTGFSIPKAQKSFNNRQKLFTKVPIFHYFKPEHHIHIKTDTSGYAIGKVLSQLAFNQYFFDHMISKNPKISKSKVGQ